MGICEGESIIEGEDLSEEFKGKIALVFEAALSEEVAKRTLSIKEALEQNLEAELSEAVETRMGEIVENVDKYLDYVVTEWTKENEIAIESGIKVEMAESLMGGLRSLFTEHNITVEEETVDVISTLETKVSDLEVSANELVSENIDLQREISSFKAGKIFDGLSEGLSDEIIKLRSIEAFNELSKSQNTKIIVTDGKTPFLINFRALERPLITIL